ncbi:Uncharacterised protein [Neisseria meningitidis]|nr:Uncharacterised protein [Neisseria meningitidis]CWP92875.1 Uncharacterised protein [Neisseria meningitidis]CWT68921.1 Uncharacterised protein [Neisseria meningitidis]
MKQGTRHQGLGIAARHIEKNEISGRVIQECRQYAAHPKIHHINRMTCRIVNQRYHPAQRACLACFQNAQDGKDGDEDAEEEFAHFGDGFKVEFVACADLFGRDCHRYGGQCNQDDIADEVLQGVTAAEDFKSRVFGFPKAGH